MQSDCFLHFIVEFVTLEAQMFDWKISMQDLLRDLLSTGTVLIAIYVYIRLLLA
jgi:hypothetical protein